MRKLNPTPILFTIPNFITAGSGRVMFNILTRLDKTKYTPSVCVLRKGGTIEKELAALGIPVLELPFTIPIKPYLTFPLRALRAAQAFRAYGFKIWHSFHYTDDYSEPVIVRLSGARRWVYTKKAMTWGTRAWQLRSWLASRIVADNVEMPGRFFSRPGLRRKVRIIHHGLPLEQFKPGAPDSHPFRGQLGLPADAFLVGCVAQLVAVKDHPNLIRAAAQLPKVHFLLAGSTTDESYLAALKQQAIENNVSDRVHFLGNVFDIVGLLNEVEIFILPTMGAGRMEGCPVALLEAMACGKACIATDIPGSRDLILHNECGLLVPPSNPVLMADAIRSLQQNPLERTRLAKNARQRVEEHFSIEKEVQAHEALYDELLSR